MSPARLLPLALILVPPLAAEHGNLADFNQRTGHWYGVARTEVPNETVELAWSPDGETLFFAPEEDGKRRLKAIDPVGGGVEAVDSVAAELRGFRRVGEDSLWAETADGWFEWRDDGWAEAEAPAEERRERRGRSRRGERGSWESPDGRWTVLERDGVLSLIDADEGAIRELGGGEGGFVGRPQWTEDSSRFAMWKEENVEERIVHYIDSSPDEQLQPEHFTRRYPKPGDAIDTRAPWVFFTDGREPLAADPRLLENPYECRALAWRGDGRRLTFEFIERGFGKHHVIEVDSESRSQRVLVREESDTFVFVSGNSFRHDLDDGREILWMSERDGWKHLYLLDGRDGSVIRQLTQGEWIVRRVVGVDEEAREVLLEVSGLHEGQDPYFIHFARVSMDSGELVVLTDADGTHDRFARSPDGRFFSCRWSRVNRAPVTELRRWKDGGLVATLAEADDSALRDTGWPLPEPFVAKDRDGRFDIHGVLCLPPDFDPEKSYPVVEKIYAGPQGSFVPKSWTPWVNGGHEIAVHGFIVVQIDGKGTANRCREFHHFCYRNLRDAGLPDRIAWMKAASERHPQMDLGRVGIFGGSAGGQNALGALLFHGDFYKAAAADCGCHDNRIDKLWWNEQWMDWPIDEHYADNSNVTHAGKLEGALLLTVGELDTNVDPSSTYQVIDALIAADRDFEFLPLTGANHGAGESRYAQRRRVDFFRRHLGAPR